MSARAEEGLDALLAFLAGAAVGGAAAGWLVSRQGRHPGRRAESGFLEAARGVGSTEASLGRIHALLGEIRALMRPREGARPSEGVSRAAGPAGAGAGGPGSAGNAPEGTNPRPGGEAWRRPDRIGYLRPAERGVVPDAAALAAGALAVGGAAAAWSLARKDGAPAVLSTAGGFLLASAWALWRRSAPVEGRDRKAGPRWKAVRVLGRVGPGRSASP